MTLQPTVGINDHCMGPADAPVVLVEYGDFQCPYSARARRVVNALLAHFGLSMRFVFRNFPLTEIHPDALCAAEVAESVAAHSGSDAYWVMHDLLFAHQGDSEWAFDDAHLVRYAGEAGADPTAVAKDLGTGAHRKRIGEEVASGASNGVRSTPTFFINGERFDGDWTNLRVFGAALDAAENSVEPDTDDPRELELEREAREGADLMGDSRRSA